MRESVVEEAEDFFGEDFEGRGINVVNGVFVQDFPQPLDDIEIGAIGR